MDAGVPLVTEYRGDHFEAIHFGHAVVLAPDGSVARRWGDPSVATYWRSAAKPLQALSFVASGAADALKLGPEAIALACGSHSSEPEHVETARRMLAAAGLSEDALQCGSHSPLATQRLPIPPGGWSPIHNNCSGKHAAMLCTCVHRDWPTASYLDPANPVQKDVLQRVRAAAGLRPGEPGIGVDGCGVPTFHAPVVALARAFQWLARSGDASAARVLDAMGRHPRLVAGTGRLCTELGLATGGRVVGKTGAAGIYGAVDRASGAAFALKVVDGSRPAAECAAVELAVAAGWLSTDEAAKLEHHRRPVVKNHVGRIVGRIEPRFA